jgi:hypothetical protein
MMPTGGTRTAASIITGGEWYHLVAVLTGVVSIIHLSEFVGCRSCSMQRATSAVFEQSWERMDQLFPLPMQ